MSRRPFVTKSGYELDWAGAREGFHGAYVWSDEQYVYIIESIGTDDTQIRIPREHAGALCKLVAWHCKHGGKRVQSVA